MTELQKLYDEKGKVIHAMRDMYLQAEKESRSLTQEEDEKFNKMDEDLKSLQARIDKGESVRKLLDEHENHMNSIPTEVAETRDQFASRKSETIGKTSESRNMPTYKEAFELYVKYGATGLSREARSVLAKGYRKDAESRAQTSSVAADGGYLSPEEWADSIVKSMKAYGGMLQASRVFQTSGGDTFHIPTTDTTSQLAVRGAQATTPGFADITYGEKTMSSHLYNSQIIKIARELHAEDSGYDVIGHVQEVVAERNARKLNLDFTDATVGDGSGNPRAILLDAVLGKTGASTTAVSRGDFLDLMHSVDPAYRMGQSVYYMMNDATLAEVKKLAISSSDDRPLWVPSMREGAPDTIEGVPYIINQDLDSMAASAKSILFGDFSKYWIRQVRGITLYRSDERFWEESVVAYMAIARFDGLLVDTAAVKYFQNAAA